MDVFSALASATRRRMFTLLLQREMHITGIARELGISVPVAAKHARVLEGAGLVECRRFGRTLVLRASFEPLYRALDELASVHRVRVERNTTVLEALKRVAGVRVERKGDMEYVTSIDGEDGLYIYEVDGEFPEVGMHRYTLAESAEVVLKKLVPVRRKVLRVEVEE
ncbi:MAG: helix-turn-helix domain-containing protein [Euryarchaeota archaeon]|nr:helix-turn-helix domain-containing protein [Euryarchaeota archaeon]